SPPHFETAQLLQRAFYHAQGCISLHKPPKSPRLRAEKHATGFTGRSLATPEPSDICPFSPGEKVRMRAIPAEFCPPPGAVPRSQTRWRRNKTTVIYRNLP